MHKKVLYHVFGGNLCCLQNFQLLGNASHPPRQKELYHQSDDVPFKHRHGYHYNGFFPGNNTETYDHEVVEDDVPLLESPSDSFLNDILHRTQAYN
jgi:hypothetical protein